MIKNGNVAGKWMVLILISVKYMEFKDKNRLAISPHSGKVTHAKKKKASFLN